MAIGLVFWSQYMRLKDPIKIKVRHGPKFSQSFIQILDTIWNWTNPDLEKSLNSAPAAGNPAKGSRLVENLIRYKCHQFLKYFMLK